MNLIIKKIINTIVTNNFKLEKKEITPDYDQYDNQNILWRGFTTLIYKKQNATITIHEFNINIKDLI